MQKVGGCVILDVREGSAVDFEKNPQGMFLRSAG